MNLSLVVVELVLKKNFEGMGPEKGRKHKELMAVKRPFCVFLHLLIQTTQSLSALTYAHVHMVVVRGSELERENTFWVQ